MRKNQFTKTNLAWLITIIVTYLLLNILISVGIINNVYRTVMMTIGINIILAISLNLIIGITGQFSLGHAGFMATGAYASGVIIKMMGEGYDAIIIGMILGVVLTSIIALIIAIPTLRLRGDYLAIATLGFAETIRIVIQNMNITNGAAGLILPKLIDWQFIFFFLVLSTIIVGTFTFSSYGRACISIREDEIASETMGINTTKYKTLAFVIGAALASIAGSLYAMSFYVIKPDMFTFNKSIDILVIVVFGGLGSYTGSYLSAIVISIINTGLQSFSDIRMIIYGILLILIMIFRPQGLLGRYEFKFSNILERPKKKEEVQS